MGSVSQFISARPWKFSKDNVTRIEQNLQFPVCVRVCVCVCACVHKVAP